MEIRQGQKGDLPAVLELIRELAMYEKAPDEVTVTLAELDRDGFGDRPLFGFIVAVEAGEVLGMALYFYSYSTWKGRCLYLEDIVVKESRRREGIGRDLFRALITKATEFGAQRLQWQVLNWNEPAIGFYRKIDAVLDGSWVNCKLTCEQMEAYLQTEPTG